MSRIYLWPCVGVAFLALGAFLGGGGVTTVIGFVCGVEHIIRTRRCLLLRLAVLLKCPQPETFMLTSLWSFTLTLIFLWTCNAQKVKLIVFQKAYSFFDHKLFSHLLQSLSKEADTDCSCCFIVAYNNPIPHNSLLSTKHRIKWALGEFAKHTT